MKIRLTRMREKAVLPVRATSGSAGMDLCACIDAPVEIAPGEIKLIPTGIAIQLPSNDQVAMIYARSGLAIKHGISLANGVGVVDSDYTGEIMVGLINRSAVLYRISPSERIAQLLIQPVICNEIEEVAVLSETERGDGGFGSTGK